MSFIKREKENHLDKDGYKTILINAIYAKDKPAVRTLSEKFSDVGGNTGNLLFSEGIKDNLIIEREGWLVNRYFKDIEKPACILPSANFIICGGDSFLRAINRFLDETDCPITLAGLGAQSTSELNTPSKLMNAINPESIRVFQRLGERAVTLGIRGEFTAECLELIGVKNYRIIGCPSAYMFSAKEGINIPNPSLKKVQITVTTGSVYETKILELGHQLNAEWIMQMPTEMPECVLTDARPNQIWCDRRLPGLKISLDTLTAYMKKYAHIFFNFEEWNKYYQESNLTFAFGSRFHGNMAALRNGIPALWITHDSRTKELTQTLHLPNISQETFSTLSNAEELFSYVDYTDFQKNYPTMLKNYQEFLSENHISYCIDN